MNRKNYNYKLIKYKKRYQRLSGGSTGNKQSNDMPHTDDEPDPHQAEIIRGTSQTIALSIDNSIKVGIMIAGNAGRPGGSVGRMDGTGIDNIEYFSQHFMENRYRTIEESVVASWMAAEYFRREPDDLDRIFRTTLGVEFKTEPKYDSQLNSIVDYPSNRPWGMSVVNSTDTSTIQGIDFTSVLEPEFYKFAFSLQDVPIIDNTVTRPPGCPCSSQRNVNLVFVYGPNVGFSGRTDIGSGRRTKVSGYNERNDYDQFKQSVTEAIRAGLEKMIADGVEIAIVARVSCGIYAGRASSLTRRHINRDYEGIITNILSMDYPLNSNRIGDNFRRVIIPVV